MVVLESGTMVLYLNYGTIDDGKRHNVNGTK